MKRILLVIPVAAALGGCGTLSGCPEPPEELVQARELPPISVPLGLENPSTAEALRIPELQEPERPRGKDAQCLDAPPSYFPDRRPGAEREEPQG